jgi:hypothetical protein
MDLAGSMLAKTWTIARWQVLCHKVVDQFLVNARQPDLVFGQPVREMADATNMVLNGERVVSVVAEVTDKRIGARSQHARFQPSI